MRIRKITKIGGTAYIQLTPTDLIDLELKVGDEIDVEDLVILNHKKKRKNAK